MKLVQAIGQMNYQNIIKFGQILDKHGKNENFTKNAVKWMEMS